MKTKNNKSSYERTYEYNFITDKETGKVKFVLYHESGNPVDHNYPQTVCIPAHVFDEISADYVNTNKSTKKK
jgi:hypothetical protein